MSSRLERKLIRFDALPDWRAHQAIAPREIVAVSGCFDLLHVGHVRYLEEASLLGDTLVVGINEDEAVRHIKGPARPIHSSSVRSEVLASLACVHHVCVFPGYTAQHFLRALKPAVWVKGGEYRRENLDPGEIDAVESNGGRIVFATYHRGHSTTGILNRAL